MSVACWAASGIAQTPSSGPDPAASGKLANHPDFRPAAYHPFEHAMAEQQAEQRKAKPKPRADTGSELAEVENAAGEPIKTSSEACEQNLALAAKRGLTLPDGWAMHCVGPGSDWDGNSHWGVTCPYDSCPEGAGPYVSVSNPTYYVISHELCHANFGNDELMADKCAAEHGASLAESPYQ
jgi:hypothetical protein